MGEKQNLNILRYFQKLILLFNSPKNPITWSPNPKNFSGISGEAFRRISQEFLGMKICKHSDQVLRISQEFSEK